MGKPGDRHVPLRPGLALLVAGVSIAGCASLESVTSPIGGFFRSSPSPSTPTPASEAECPQVTVRTGAATWQVPAGAAPTAVRYQASLGQLARECAILGDTMTIKVGVEGRVLVGPRGGPGSVEVPLRIALVQEGTQPRSIWTKFYPIPVSVTPGTTQAVFAQVEDDLTFQLPINRGDLQSYIVYVGFDPQAAADALRQKQKRPPGAKPKPKPKPKAAEPAAPPPQQPGFAAPQQQPPPGVFAPPPPPPPQR
jgi:hypothetical protein